MASTTIIRATESFSFVGPNGGPVTIRKGSTFHRESSRLAGLSDEAVERNFEPFVPDHDIETATAAPGERRKGGPRRPKASGAEEKASDEAKQPETPGNVEPTNLSDLKQPELKALLDERGIDYPSGVVSNANLIELLQAADQPAE